MQCWVTDGFYSKGFGVVDSGCYVIVDHPYLDPAPVFGPYESRQEAVEDFGGWWKAITAANGQLLEDHEDKIRVIVRVLSPESRVRPGFAGGEDWIYSNYLKSALPAGRELFLQGDGARRQEWEAKRQAREEAQELRTARLKEERRLKEEEAIRRREDYLTRAAGLGLDERAVFLLDRVSELEAELADCRARKRH